MTPELAAAFAELKAPCRCSKRAAHDQLAPILKMATELQEQIALERRLLLAAELLDDTFEGELERIHQKHGALETDLKDFIRLGRRIALSVAHKDEAARHAEDGIAKALKKGGAQARAGQ